MIYDRGPDIGQSETNHYHMSHFTYNRLSRPYPRDLRTADSQ